MNALGFVGRHPLYASAALTVAAYALVIGTFAGIFTYPDIGRGAVDVMAHAIAAVNSLALLCIVAGVYFVRKGELVRHRNLMLAATALILLFLVIYLFRVGGGGTKVFEGPGFVRSYVYLPMLAVHLVLSIAAVPLVIYAVVLGVTRPLEEVGDTLHPRVGQVAAFAWALSLFLGVVTYFMLNHLYEAEFQPAVVVLPL